MPVLAYTYLNLPSLKQATVMNQILPCKKIRKIGRQIDNAHAHSLTSCTHRASAFSASASQNHRLSDKQNDNRAAIMLSATWTVCA